MRLKNQIAHTCFAWSFFLVIAVSPVAQSCQFFFFCEGFPFKVNHPKKVPIHFFPWKPTGHLIVFVVVCDDLTRFWHRLPFAPSPHGPCEAKLPVKEVEARGASLANISPAQRKTSFLFFRDPKYGGCPFGCTILGTLLKKTSPNCYIACKMVGGHQCPRK